MANKDFKGIINFFAFVAIVLVGTTLLLANIGITAEINGALTIIANVLAYLVTAIAAFYFVKNKNNIWFWLVYAVALVLIVVSYII